MLQASPQCCSGENTDRLEEILRRDQQGLICENRLKQLGSGCTAWVNGGSGPS